MKASEEALVFTCAGSPLVGILHRPEQANSRAVLIVVGGPQYRVGSHRQFLLLARWLAERGTPVLRFDYRGMGDSGGEPVSFERIGPDIKAAVDVMFAKLTGLSEVVLWGLCDGASAALMYAYLDRRISGMVLVNPWVRTEESVAKAYLQHYYRSRIVDWEAWKRIFSGKVDLMGTISDVLNGLRSKFRSGRASDPAAVLYTERMLEGMEKYRGHVLIVLSGDDLTAAEFKDEIKSSRRWNEQMRRSDVQRRDLPEANHTFSQRAWRDQVSAWTERWLVSW